MGVEHVLFDWFDYILFVVMLLISAGIGVYFGFFDKQNTTADYIHGGKTMATFPVAVSLIASSISGTSIVGVPAEIYIHGMIYWLGCFSAIFVGLICHYVYLPVFFKLQLTSTYEYLELRFNHGVRKFASTLFAFSLLTFIPIIMYVPALAFSYATGISVHLVSPLVCIVCIFYTMLGGLKAVIWTDFVQGFVMVGASSAVIILGVINVGGIKEVFQISYDGDRLHMDEFNPSPFRRDTVWAVLLGTTFMWLANIGVNQGYVQKFLSTPDLKAAKRSLLFFVFGAIFMNTISCFTGLIIYASYAKCDPITSKLIKRPDQLLPFFVMDTATSIPGLPGLFIAGVFSASLSTMSSALNSLSATVYMDFVKPCFKGREMRENRINLFMKLIVVVVGAICVLLVFVVERLGTVLELSFSVAAITGGALLGLFTLGMFFPWANATGAIVGSLTSIFFILWIVIGAQSAIWKGQLPHPWLPTTIEGCPANNLATNGTLSTTTSPNNVTGAVELEPPFILYRIAFYYFGVIGPFWVVIVGLIVSFLTGPRNPNDMSRDLFVTFVHKYCTFDEVVKPDIPELEHLTRNKKHMHDFSEKDREMTVIHTYGEKHEKH